MKPTFKNTLAWEQAQVLMQPAMLRVVDNIRKEIENSHWQGTYKESLAIIFVLLLPTIKSRSTFGNFVIRFVFKNTSQFNTSLVKRTKLPIL
jgi:hypothetical protein